MSLKTFAIAAAAATVAFTTVLPASQAEAGHRHHRNALYAGAGFLGGVFVGSLLSERRYPNYYSYGALPAAHVQSCFDRYRSYNVHTNTWVDYSMRTRVCYSPYYY